jgi:hypothetical protein
MRTPEDTRPETWDRFFAASANNVAWTLAELPTAELDPNALLDAAHAAAWHWQHVGTELHRMRARTLLALAHARAGLGASALAYSEEVRAYLLQREGTTDWEIALAHFVHAHAASAAGDAARHAASYAEGMRALAAIDRDEDREVVKRVLANVPTP